MLNYERQSLFFTAPFAVEWRAETITTLPADCVLVETAYSGISTGTELMLYRGRAPQAMAADAALPALSGSLAYPLKYGYACVGRVIATGAAVSSAWIGRYVFAFNPHETAFVASVANVHPLPASILPAPATLLPNMETALGLVMDSGLKFGERAVVFGQGIVGLLVTLVLKQIGLAELVTVEPHARRRQKSADLGARVVSDATAVFGARQTPFDVAIELTGNPAVLETAVRSVGYGGRVVVGSWYGTQSAPLALGDHFHRNHIEIVSSQVSTINPRWRGRWSKQRRLDWAWHQLVTHQPAHLITDEIAFDEAERAYQKLDQRSAETIQVVLNYGAKNRKSFS